MGEQPGATEKRPNLPERLESIETLLQSSHEIVSRMQPPEGTDADKAPTPVGIEQAATRIEHSLQLLNTRLVGIAERVGQL